MLTKTITACFERALQQSPIGIDDNFFDLGGDSLLALSLLLEIKKATGQELAIATIYDGATVRAMVEVLERTAPVRFDPTVKLKAGANVAPIFLLHGLFGNAMELIDLGRQISSARPVYALQARGLDGQDAPHDTVEAMAADYVDAITRRQPRGPYILLGYSFGGLVAIEMTRLLQARGDEVAFLGCIDSYPPKHLWSRRARFGVGARQIRNRVIRLYNASHDEAVRLLWQKVSRRSTTGLIGAANLESVGQIALPDTLRRLRKAAYHAFERYTPSPYPGPVVFFRPSRPREFPADPRSTWQHYLPRLQMHTLRGDHYSLLRSDVATTAQRLSEYLETAVPVGDKAVRAADAVAERKIPSGGFFSRLKRGDRMMKSGNYGYDPLVR